MNNTTLQNVMNTTLVLLLENITNTTLIQSISNTTIYATTKTTAPVYSNQNVDIIYLSLVSSLLVVLACISGVALYFCRKYKRSIRYLNNEPI